MYICLNNGRPFHMISKTSFSISKRRQKMKLNHTLLGFLIRVPDTADIISCTSDRALKRILHIPEDFETL